MSHHVARERIADTSVSNLQGGIPARPAVGSLRHSRTFPTASAAQREADAWNGTGDWRAVIREGMAPDRSADRDGPEPEPEAGE